MGLRALHFIEVGKLAWREAKDMKVAGPLEAVVRPIASTTCDLDRRIIRGLVDLGADFPIGHECVAEVLEIGDQVKRVAPGNVVVVPWHISCGVCPECRRGLSAACSLGARPCGLRRAYRWRLGRSIFGTGARPLR